MNDYKVLAGILRKIDGRSYAAYKEIEGTFLFLDFTLIIDHAQGDPFASPSQVRVQVPQNIADFPTDTFLTKSRSVSLRDFLTREFKKGARHLTRGKGTGKSGEVNMPPVGQEILERSAVIVNDQLVEARFTVGLPANGRKITGLKAMEILIDEIPKLVNKSLKFKALDHEVLYRHIRQAEDADFIRKKLLQQNLVAFVGEGSILPRRSGVDQRPLTEQPIPFESPEAFKISFETPNTGVVSGMGIPKGITLIVGGGYHGKSTLLNALSRGVYNHIPGDGREFVITHPLAVKIKAEDGRSVQKVNITPFINNLPGNTSTREFSTTNASGSTSQSANIIEALEAGAKVFLIDEDTSATNFMIRDHRMQLLVQKEKEPITPFIDKVLPLYQENNVSTVLVMGGSGDYFDVADHVIRMDNFKPKDVTAEAKEIAQQNPTHRMSEGGSEFGLIKRRRIFLKSLDPSRGKKSVNVKTRSTDNIGFGKEDIDLSAVDQLVDNGQLKAIAEGILFIKKDPQSKELTLPEILNKLDMYLMENGIHTISHNNRGDLVRFRVMEMAAAINRIRGLIILD
ncbi:MAG: ABC-ATPase domain-containing protein [Candidatus Cyclobacteriaceae bacterium M3_2C_046]